ncbi:hypothetical protein D1013_14980 [Euzebyella marina]|uniref:Uncharacterized protein n=1 Tax=Euzebyella marina TaxID=1761453 RepID=A0A3G2L8I6_9FLAO|nr:hypothetical protein [Euzebyella marina]AYN68585.1 hypothetical protein D1013_14980 [Euzebyella marina]
MQVQFRTKDEANMEQERDFLALSPTERVYSFLDLMQNIHRFPTKAKESHDNFIIQITTGK